MTAGPPHSGPGRLIVVAGPSGVGKSTLVAEALRRRPDLWLSVSVTTRRPRPGEADGREYRFVSRSDFDAMRERGEFLEWAEFAGHCYGTPLAPVRSRLARGEDVLLEIDLQGVRQIRRVLPEAVTVFVAPPSRAELRRRLSGRGTENPAELEARVRTAEAELAAAPEFDHTIVNADLGSAASELVALVADPPPGA